MAALACFAVAVIFSGTRIGLGSGCFSLLVTKGYAAAEIVRLPVSIRYPVGLGEVTCGLIRVLTLSSHKRNGMVKIVELDGNAQKIKSISLSSTHGVCNAILRKSVTTIDDHVRSSHVRAAVACQKNVCLQDSISKGTSKFARLFHTYALQV